MALLIFVSGAPPRPYSSVAFRTVQALYTEKLPEVEPIDRPVVRTQWRYTDQHRAPAGNGPSGSRVERRTSGGAAGGQDGMRLVAMPGCRSSSHAAFRTAGQ